MKRCIAFLPTGRSGHAWRPCKKAPKPQGVFCATHERVIGGLMLGICISEYPDGVQHSRKPTLADMPVRSKVPS